MRRPSASAARAPSSTARQFKTGSAPGKPRQTGQVFEFGSSPNRVEQPQKIFDSVLSCACTSSPIIVSQLFIVSSSEFQVSSSSFKIVDKNSNSEPETRNLLKAGAKPAVLSQVELDSATRATAPRDLLVGLTGCRVCCSTPDAHIRYRNSKAEMEIQTATIARIPVEGKAAFV